jgi:hypothetical protein
MHADEPASVADHQGYQEADIFGVTGNWLTGPQLGGSRVYVPAVASLAGRASVLQVEVHVLLSKLRRVDGHRA